MKSVQVRKMIVKRMRCRDKLSGGSGDDEFTGGAGADTFKCGSGDNDQINDFNEGEGDTKSNDCEIF